MSAIHKHRRLLGDNVRAKRKEAGFSQEKLAERADLSAVFISRIERGVESPSVDNYDLFPCDLCLLLWPIRRFSVVSPCKSV